MSLIDLLVIVGAELILLASIAAMMLHNRKMDVLSRRRSDEGRRAAPGRSKAKQTPQPTRQEHTARHAATVEPAKESPFWQRHRQRELTAPRGTSDDPVSQSPERGAEPATSKKDERSIGPIEDNGSPVSFSPGVRIDTISDIHGQSDLLRQMLHCIEADLPAASAEAYDHHVHLRLN
jgi:hypothetical protein